MEQKVIYEKISEGYSVKVLHDNNLIWTDHFENKKELDLFMTACDSTIYYSEAEARKKFLDGEYGVNIFYRHPKGYRFTSIFNLDASVEDDEKGFEVFFVDKDHDMTHRNVSTIDEAFDLIKKVENGLI